VTDNVVSRLKSNRAQGRPRGPSRRGTSQWEIPWSLLHRPDPGRPSDYSCSQEHDSWTHARYLYTTELSEEVEEACRVGDRGAPQGRQGPGTGGLLILEEGEASGLPHDLHRGQCRQLIGELNLGSVEAFLRFSSAV